MKLFSVIKSKYGREAVTNVRRLESVAKKIARFRNHLVLSLRCKQSGFLPSSLRLRCPVNSERAKSIVRNAESQLVNERIRLINSQLTTLRDEYRRLTDWVKCGLSAELADTVFTHVLTVQENEFVKTKARHLQKFECFLDSKKRQEESVFGKVSELQRDKWVVNLSNMELSTQHKNVLARGLNFAIAPSVLPKEEFVIAIEKASWGMEPDEGEVFRNEVLSA